VNPEAYEQVLKGRYYQAKSTNEAVRKAIECYNQAIAIDERNALAYALLSNCYRWLADGSFLDPSEARPKAEASARKALELDEGLAEAHYALARLNLNAWDWVGAEQEARRAIEINPNLSRAHSTMAFLLSRLSRHEQAIDEARKARELDPLTAGASINLGYIFYFARQYGQAVEQVKKTMEMDNNLLGHEILGYTYAAMGRYNEAIAEYKEHLRLTGDSTSTQCYLAYALAKAGKREEAEEIRKTVGDDEAVCIACGIGSGLYSIRREGTGAIST